MIHVFPATSGHLKRAKWKPRALWVRGTTTHRMHRFDAQAVRDAIIETFEK